VNQFSGLAVVDFTTQPLDVDVDQVRPGIELVFPHVLAELRSREHPIRRPHQTLQQRKFPTGEIDAPIASPGGSRGNVKGEV
jgi:hypothetical protein